MITQAVKNLVGNAIKYSPERTTVTVSTALEAETVRLVVEDRGYGIPAEAKDRVWEKFYRVVREGEDKDEESTLHSNDKRCYCRAENCRGTINKPE